MDTKSFSEILWVTFQQEIKLYIVAFVCSIIALAVGIMRFSLRKNDNRNSGSCIFLAILIFVVTSIMTVTDTIAYRHEVLNEQFVEIYGNYSFDPTTSQKGRRQSRASVYIKSGGEEFMLQLPANWSENDFPEGYYTGTICYAKESEVILRFIPDNTLIE